VALICTVFSPVIPDSWKGEAHAEVARHLRRNHRRPWHIQTCLHNPTMRRGGRIDQYRVDRLRHELERTRPAAAAAKQTAQPSRIRIVNEPEATLLQHKHARFTPASCGFFGNLSMIPRTKNETKSRFVPWNLTGN
jgi:hypothetical protein